jgi:hypothetical protein
MSSLFCVATEFSPNDPSSARAAMSRGALSFPVVTKLVARTLGVTPEALRDSFRLAVEDDLTAILTLRRVAFGSNLTWDDERYLRWRYAFDGCEAFGQMFVVKLDHRVVGMIGAECVRLVHGGRSENSMSLMDVLVDSSLEDAGLGVWLNMAVFERCALIFEIGANQNSLGTIDRLYHRLPNRTCYSYPLTLSSYLERRLRVNWLAMAFAIPLNAALQLARVFAFPSPSSRWQFRDVQRFDAAVESVFDARANAAICVERSARWLNWRLFDNPRSTCEVIGAYDGDRLDGYIAFHRRGAGSKAHTIDIVDWLVVRQQGRNLVRRLVSEVVRRAVASKAEFVRATMLAEPEGRILRKLGFVQQSNEYLTAAVRVQDKSAYAHLFDGSGWFLTDANTDTDRA